MGRGLEEPQSLRKSETGFLGDKHDIGDHTACFFVFGKPQEVFVYQKLPYCWLFLLIKVVRAHLNSC